MCTCTCIYMCTYVLMVRVCSEMGRCITGCNAPESVVLQYPSMASVVHFPLQIVVYSQHAIYTCVYTYTCTCVCTMHVHVHVYVYAVGEHSAAVGEGGGCEDESGASCHSGLTAAGGYGRSKRHCRQRQGMASSSVTHIFSLSWLPRITVLSHSLLTPISPPPSLFLLSLFPPPSPLPPSSLSPRHFFAGVAAAAESQPSAAGRGEEAGSHHGPLYGGPQRHGDSPAPGRG